MANPNNKIVDDIFDQVEDAIFSSSKVVKDVLGSSVKRPTQTASSKSVAPYVDAMVEKTAFRSRYDHFKKSIDSLVYGKYPQDKRNGFDEVINRYVALADNNKKNFKVLEEQISQDIDKISKDIVKNNDSYLFGYYDGLLLIKKILKQSKIARLRELATIIK